MGMSQMVKTNIHTDLYETKHQFTGVRVERGYIGDCDVHIESSDTCLSFRLSDDQAIKLLSKLKNVYENHHERYIEGVMK